MSVNLDTFVKISQIMVPFLIVGAGYFISLSVNKQANSNTISSRFHTKWTDKFIEKCVYFSDQVTEFISKLAGCIQEDVNSEKRASEINKIISNIQKSEYEVTVSAGLVENSDEAVQTVNTIRKKVDRVLKTKQISTKEILGLQVQLNKQLISLQKKTLGLK